MSARTPPRRKKLRAFIHSLLLRVFEKGPIAWHGKIMSREMVDPTAALDAIIAEKIRPWPSNSWPSSRKSFSAPVTDEARAFVRFQYCEPVRFLSSLPTDCVTAVSKTGNAGRGGHRTAGRPYYKFFTGGVETPAHDEALSIF
jgi:hypothetical protein